MSLDLERRLACGADPAMLVDQVAEGHPEPRGAHQRACSRCRAALAYLERRWAPVREWAGEDLPPPPWLVGSVMARVRLAALGPAHTLHDGPRGRTIVTDWVLQAISRQALSTVPGVRLTPFAGTGGSTAAAGSPRRRWAGPGAEPLQVEVAIGPEGASTVRVRLSLVVEVGAVTAAAGPEGAGLRAVAGEVRRAVAGAIETMTRLSVAAVDVVVVDVVEAGGAALSGAASWP